MKAKVRYAKSGDAHIAYRVFGDGPRDIVLIPGTISHVELFWELPNREHLLERLTAFARVIVFDKRGQGLSDRVGDHTLEERIGDVRAVVDAAGSETATIYGWSEGGPMCLMFAATYPERTSALVLFGSFASMRAEPWGLVPEQFEVFCSALEAQWGEGILLPLVAPSRSQDKAFLECFGRLERSSATPGSIIALMRANYDIDVRHLLPSIHVPTLILHRSGDALVPVAAGRYLADHIPGAKYVELPGSDHMIVDHETEDVIADEIEEFITGAHRRLQPDRVLATFDGPARAIRCACAVREKLRPLGLHVRTGLHTGECELIGEDIGGIAVHIGARVAATAGADEVLVSSTVRDLVAGSGIQFADRGTHALKGVPGEWRLFRTP